MTNTTNLSLVKPDLNTEIYQTISDLSTNFQKLDDVTELYRNGMPLYGDWVVPRRSWELAPVAGGYAGWITVRSGKAAPKWQSQQTHNINDLIVPITNNGHYYKCIQSGVSGVNEPTFPTASGAIIEDAKNASFWQSTTSFASLSIIKPTLSNDRFYVCTNSGVSGGTEPTWLTTEGSVTSDNGVQWTCHVIVKWQEAGTSALFKRFGLIDA